MAKRNKTKGAKVVSKEKKVRSIEPEVEIRELLEDAGKKALQAPTHEHKLMTSTQMPRIVVPQEALSNCYEAIEELAAARESTTSILPLVFQTHKESPPIVTKYPTPVPTIKLVEAEESPPVNEMISPIPQVSLEVKEQSNEQVEDELIGGPLANLRLKAEQTAEEAVIIGHAEDNRVNTEQVELNTVNIERVELNSANIEHLADKTVHSEQLEDKQLNKEQTEEKLLTIKQVATILQVEMSTIRFWEKEFAEYLGASLIRNQRKCFSSKQLEIFTKIKELLKTEQYTIDGAKRRLELDHILTSSLGVEHNFKTTVFIMLTAIMQELQVSRQEGRELSQQLEKLEQEKHQVEDQLQEEQKKGLLEFIKTKLNKKSVVGREA